MDQKDWNHISSNLLKAELARVGIGYEELTRRLKTIGVDETYKSASSKINRGTFSFAFFLQCMKALNKTDINIGEL